MMPATLIAPAISSPLRTARCPAAWNTGAANSRARPKKMSQATMSTA